jgi:hypothetical protein
MENGATGNILEAEYGRRLLRDTVIVSAVAFGSGIAGLLLIGFTLVVEPVVVVESNLVVRIAELVFVAVGVLSLLAEFRAKTRLETLKAKNREYAESSDEFSVG